MADIHLIQITEKLPPSLHGIGDYAYNLACKFKEKHGIGTSFVLLDTIEDPKISHDFPIYSLPQLKATLDNAFSNLLEINPERNVVILHFDRGTYDIYINKKFYERYNLPFSLFKSLKYLRKKYKKIALGIVFHEFLSPKIERRRDYILRPFQNIFMRSIVKTADFSFCSNPVVAKQIIDLYPQTKIFMLPVFSNIGEPGQNVLDLKKDGLWVIFGSTDNIIKTLKKFIYHLPLIKTAQAINTVNILGGYKSEVVIDLISEIKQQVPSVNYYPMIQNQEAKNIFKISKFCYMYYFNHDLVENPTLIFKSGVFAASCSYGVIPVFGNEGMEDAIGVFEHPGFVFLKNSQFKFPDNNKLNELSKDLFYWYQKRSTVETAVNIFLNAIKQL